MEAIILAGGFGTRLQTVVSDVPKPMAPVAGEPFLEKILRFLAKNKFKRVILSLGYMADKIVAHFGDNFMDMDLIYEIESEPLGTGGAIRAGLNRTISDHVFIFNGDTYLNLEISEVEQLWKTHQKSIIVLRNVQDTSRYGSVAVADGRVISFLEKGISGPGLINAGCYVFPTAALDAFPIGKNFSLESDYFANNLSIVQFNSFITQGLFIDIGVPEDYQLAQTLLADL
jgi:D-glycero-alpha-D-manno-heptose 1-phosphate guanylyltransferase